MWTKAKEPCWLQILQEARTRDHHELQGVGKSWEPVSKHQPSQRAVLYSRAVHRRRHTQQVQAHVAECRALVPHVLPANSIASISVLEALANGRVLPGPRHDVAEIHPPHLPLHATSFALQSFPLWRPNQAVLRNSIQSVLFDEGVKKPNQNMAKSPSPESFCLGHLSSARTTAEREKKHPQAEGCAEKM